MSLQSQITNNKQHKVFEIYSPKENTQKNANILQAHSNQLRLQDGPTTKTKAKQENNHITIPAEKLF